MVDKDLVRACYRVLLGRDPENESVVEETLADTSSAEDLVRRFFNSHEFQNRLPARLRADYFRARSRVDVDASEKQQELLFQRTRSQWRALGRKEPFWSVFTAPEYLAVNIDDAARARLYETGAEHAALVSLFCERNEVHLPRGVCLELGSGVGRVTKYLSRAFERVVAVDVSEGNLEYCKTMIEAEGISNIEIVLLETPEDVAKLPNVDCFYSTIVLQHNPPPLQKFMLDQILGRVTGGGVFLFQTQTYDPGYEFDTDGYLEAPAHSMEMHSFPMHEVLNVIARNGGRALEIAADTWTGRYGSHTFFGVMDP
jgi:SAM-dependent methyltransferase